jgi:Sugar transferases involved in lipopolysaccharide synthesis
LGEYKVKKIIGVLLALFPVCFGLGFIVSKIEVTHGKKGWVEGHKPYGIYEKHIKRPLDFALALFVLILFWPILLIIAIAVRVNMGSPVIFKQKRPGLGRKIFSIYKFRTMTDAKDAEDNPLPDNQRLTPFGSWLRRVSGDEAFELINIIRGDLAIVGPRPLLVEYLDRYSEEQMHRHDVRPGLTGRAQTEGRNLVSWEDKFKKDVEYANHITFLGDLKILVKTIRVVIKREGISSKTSSTMEAFIGNDK